MPKKIILISCVKQKESIPLQARSLYISDWFKKASHYASQNSNEWYILSARYGLVLPTQIIEPYNITLKSMSNQERKNWADRVWITLKPLIMPGDNVVFLAGKIYRENLIDPIIKSGCNVEIPMEGLRIGKQKSWLNRQLGVN
jgi:cytoplasmic iron level regulating protein YaaA (DUF328/UPF0246 family)